MRQWGQKTNVSSQERLLSLSTPAQLPLLWLVCEARIGRGIDCAICPSTHTGHRVGPPSICAFSSPPAAVSQLVHGWLFLPTLPAPSPPRNGARSLPATRRRGTASFLSCSAAAPEVDSHPLAAAVLGRLLNRNSLRPPKAMKLFVLSDLPPRARRKPAHLFHPVCSSIL